MDERQWMHWLSALSRPTWAAKCNLCVCVCVCVCVFLPVCEKQVITSATAASSWKVNARWGQSQWVVKARQSKVKFSSPALMAITSTTWVISRLIVLGSKVVSVFTSGSYFSFLSPLFSHLDLLRSKRRRRRNLVTTDTHTHTHTDLPVTQVTRTHTIHSHFGHGKEVEWLECSPHSALGGP